MKNIAVDFRRLNDFTGFGNISRTFAPLLSAVEDPDLHFIFMVPDNYIGAFGNKVDYISCENPEEDIARQGLHIDLWHATDQLFGYIYRSDDSLLLLTLHDLNFLYEKKHIHKWKHIWLFKKKIESVNHIASISHFTENDLMRVCRWQDKPHSIIYNGVAPMEEREGVKPEFVEREDEPFFFTISQLRKKKNFHTLVPMMRHFPDHRLYICGEDHFAYVKEIRKAIEQLGCDRVKITGRITEDEKIWLYRHCKAFVFPSKYEGFGIPVIEAMQHGCCVFSSRMTSLPEICNKYAYYWDNFEADHMAEVVRKGLAADTPQVVEERKEYAQKFNYDNYMKAYIQLYKKLLGIG